MKLTSIAQGSESLIYLERYVDEGTKSYSRYSLRSETAPAYKPAGRERTFSLLTVRIPLDRVQIVQVFPDPRLKNLYIHEKDVKFAIHPETWGGEEGPFLKELRAMPQDEPIEVSPTASTRTVFARNILPLHFLKLHYPKYVSRFNRRLRRLNIWNSIAVTREVTNIDHPRFAYLPDALGIIFGEGEDAWGFIVRDALPHPVQKAGFLIPCFGLYGGDLLSPADPPLLVQLIEHAGAEPSVFVVENIMIPVVECWARLARERGILLESHAQNTLLELGDDLLPRRIVHRDFDVWIDFEARRRLGLDIPFLGEGIAGHPAEQYYSLIYDHFIGREFFDYLLKLLRRFYDVDEESIREQVRERFNRAFPEQLRFFPSHTTYYFSEQVSQGEPYAFANTHTAPEWR